MQPFQQRVVDEKKELDEKLAKLVAFFDTEMFANVPADEQKRLHLQCKTMEQYSTILGQRIAAFTT
jgi:hypothetical protein